MKISEFATKYFKDDFTEYCVYEGSSNEEISKGSDVCIDAYDLDRDGLSKMANDCVELADTFSYWLDDSDDGQYNLDEILTVDEFVIHCEMSMGAFSDESADASGRVTIYWCESEAMVEERVESCRKSVLDGMTQYLASPLRIHRDYLGTGSGMGVELSKVIDYIINDLPLNKSIKVIESLDKEIQLIKKKYCLTCFASLFPNASALSIQYKEETREILLQNGVKYLTNELIESVDNYLHAAVLLGTNKTVVDADTLCIAQSILES